MSSRRSHVGTDQKRFSLSTHPAFPENVVSVQLGKFNHKYWYFSHNNAEVYCGGSPRVACSNDIDCTRTSVVFFVTNEKRKIVYTIESTTLQTYAFIKKINNPRFLWCEHRSLLSRLLNFRSYRCTTPKSFELYVLTILFLLYVIDFKISDL